MEDFQREVIERLMKMETEIRMINQNYTEVSKIMNIVAVLSNRVDQLERENKTQRGAMVSIIVGIVVAIATRFF